MAQRRTAVGMDAVGAQPAAAARLDQHAVRRVALQPYVVQAVTMRDRGCNHTRHAITHMRASSSFARMSGLELLALALLALALLTMALTYCVPPAR